MIKVTCLGAAGSVTGSCFLVENVQGKKVMVDCGLFQGQADGASQLEKLGLQPLAS